MELFRDATLDDPRLDPFLDPRPSPPIGVMLNEKARDMADKSKGIDGGWVVELSAGESVGGEGREGGGDLSVRSVIATYKVDYIRPGTSYPRDVCYPTERSQQRFYLSGLSLSQHTWTATMCVQGSSAKASLVVFKSSDDLILHTPRGGVLEYGQMGERHSRVLWLFRRATPARDLGKISARFAGSRPEF